MSNIQMTGYSLGGGSFITFAIGRVQYRYYQYRDMIERLARMSRYNPGAALNYAKRFALKYEKIDNVIKTESYVYRIKKVYQGYRDRLEALRFIVQHMPLLNDDEYFDYKRNCVFLVKKERVS